MHKQSNAQKQQLWRTLTKWSQRVATHKKGSSPCQREETRKLLNKWEARAKADRSTKSAQATAARLTMRRVEEMAGVTHKEYTLTSEGLVEAIKRNDYIAAKRLSSTLVDIDQKLYDAAKGIDVDIAYLRAEVLDAKTRYHCIP